MSSREQQHQQAQRDARLLCERVRLEARGLIEQALQQAHQPSELVLREAQRIRELALKEAQRQRELALKEAQRQRELALKQAQQQRELALKEVQLQRELALNEAQCHRDWALLEALKEDLRQRKLQQEAQRHREWAMREALKKHLRQRKEAQRHHDWLLGEAFKEEMRQSKLGLKETQRQYPRNATRNIGTNFSSSEKSAPNFQSFPHSQPSPSQSSTLSQLSSLPQLLFSRFSSSFSQSLSFQPSVTQTILPQPWSSNFSAAPTSGDITAESPRQQADRDREEQRKRQQTIFSLQRQLARDAIKYSESNSLSQDLTSPDPSSENGTGDQGQSECICCVCLGTLSEIISNGSYMMATRCGHVLCHECFKQIFSKCSKSELMHCVSRPESKCPECNQQVSRDDVIRLYIG